MINKYQQWSKWLQLVKTNSITPWTKYQTWSNMIKHDQTWSNMIKHDQTWSTTTQYHNTNDQNDQNDQTS
jgi:hypothetical protein